MKKSRVLKKFYLHLIIYSDIFPGVQIKRGDGSMNLWSLTDGYNNYLATSPSGTATGFGCTWMIIDDLIKSAEEAYNETILENEIPEHVYPNLFGQKNF